MELLIQLFWRQNQPPGSKRMAKESDLGIEERQDEDESRQARASQHRQHSLSQQEKNLYEFHGSDTDVEASMPSSKVCT